MFSHAFHKRARELNEMAGKPYKRARYTKKTYGKPAKTGSNKRFAKVDTGPERKRSDTSFQSIATRAPGNVYPLNIIAQGSDNIQRIGRQILLKSYQYKFLWTCTGSNLATTAAYPNGSNTLRIAIVYDKQTNQAPPAIDDIWQLGTSATQNPFLLRNLDNYDRFTVLSDDLHNISTAGPNGVTFEKYGAISLPTRYDGTGGANTDITTGGLYLITIDINNTISNQSVINGMARVSYTDM